jgi:hypothetical protein
MLRKMHLGHGVFGEVLGVQDSVYKTVNAEVPLYT